MVGMVEVVVVESSDMVLSGNIGGKVGDKVTGYWPNPQECV